MPTSNSLFFQVIGVPPMENIGWTVRVVDYLDFTTVVADIPEFIELNVGPELCAPGAGSITLDADDPFWTRTLANDQPATSLLDYEYLWQAYEDGELRYEWLGSKVKETLLDDSETRGITIAGPGAGEVLRWAKILPPGFPKPPPAGLDPETAVTYRNDVVTLGWEFPLHWPAMQMWWTLFKAAQSRGTIPWIQPLFTETADAAGAPWEYIPTTNTASGYSGFRPEQGMDLLDFLNLCTGQDYSKHFAERAEWMLWPRFNLDVRKSIGVHREDQVIFYEAALVQKERTRVRDEIANYVAVIDQNGDFSLATDADSINKWNRREQLENHNLNIVDPVRRNAISQVFLEQRRDEKSEWVIQVPYDQPGRRPFRDYNIGDWVGVSAYRSGQPSTVDAYRVLAIVVNVADDVPVVELTLQSKIEFYQHQLEAKLTQIINEINNWNGGVPPIPDIPPYPGPGGISPLDEVPYVPVLTPDGWGKIPLPGGWGNGSGGGVRVFIQDTDPGDEARPGDFWFNTAYSPEPPYELEPLPEPEEPAFDYIPDTRERVPGTNIWFE